MPKRKAETNDEIIYIKHQIDSIDDLIYLGRLYEPGKKYNIDLEKLFRLIPILTKLQKVIGMQDVKKNITNQIIYFIQGFQDKNSDMLHTVIQGPPGVGKTMLGEIIGEIYFTLDIIEQNNQLDKPTSCCDSDASSSSSDYNSDNNSKPKFKFTIAKRSDLIGKYLGHTAAKTQDLINKSLGGVLFIDEAYSLGNSEGTDSFSKECIDTINQNLTEKKNQLLVIIAGYTEALDSCFFNYNEGLRRRFPFVYTIEKYTNIEMSNILQKMIKELGKDWEIIAKQEILDGFFQSNIIYFPNSAGDIETLVFAIKIEHAKRVFYYESNSYIRKKITDIDIENALKIYISNRKKKELNNKSDSHLMMYL